MLKYIKGLFFDREYTLSHMLVFLFVVTAFDKWYETVSVWVLFCMVMDAFLDDKKSFFNSK